MTKKFDLYQELLNKGFENQESMFGFTLTKSYEKEVEVAWHGKMKTTYKVQVVFNEEKTVATVSYYKNNAPKATKVKTHLNEKRAFNAIKETVKNAGYEM